MASDSNGTVELLGACKSVQACCLSHGGDRFDGPVLLVFDFCVP